MTINGFSGVIPRVTEDYRWYRTNGFTIGEYYPFIAAEGNGAVVLNDNGHPRFVMLDGSQCSHITINDVDKMLGIKGWMEPRPCDPGT